MITERTSGRSGSKNGGVFPAHISRGRVRFRVSRLLHNPELKAQLESGLRQRKEVSHVSANTWTGSIVIHFNAGAKLESMHTAVSSLVGKFDEPAGALPAVIERGSGSSFDSLLSSETLVQAKHLGKELVSSLIAAPAQQERARWGPHGEQRPQPATPAAMRTDWHALTPEAALQALNSRPAGLSVPEASERLQWFGPNALPRPRPPSAWKIFLNQFKSLPVALLVGSAAVSVITGGMADAAVILVVVVLNATIGATTEIGAERTISALGTMEEPVATVIREGKSSLLSASEIVPGDVLLLHRGQYIPADARLMEVNELSVAESVLTGESVPVLKQVTALPFELSVSDRANMIFRGTIVTGGSAVAVVVATGLQTEIGRIQALITETLRPETPIERQLDKLGRQLVFVCLAITGGVLVIGLLRGFGAVEMFRMAISLAVAAVPEGLPALATSTLAYGMWRLRQQNILVRNLNAVETLGDIQILCLDKTGTLTTNRMSVVEAVADLEPIPISQRAPSNKAKVRSLYKKIRSLAEVAVLCSEAEYAESDGVQIIRGSSTETALLELCRDCGVVIEELRRRWPTLSTSHRSETRNLMSTLHRAKDGRRLMAMKGSPEEVLDLCGWRKSKSNELLALTAQDRDQILAENSRMASAGQRVLGVAYLETDQAAGRSPEINGSDLIWLGLVGLADPPRPESSRTLRVLHRAGIKTRMITGDQEHTALAIAQQVGMIRAGGEPDILDFSKLGNANGAAAERFQHVDVFSRVNPGNKLEIVQALQRNGHVVGMTGDGINDGPALKRADIGIAMGQSGAETAREVADIILLDDDLQAILTAIAEGRTIHENIRKAVHYITATNLSEIMTVGTSLALGLGQALTPRQLLWINLLTDIFPGLALAVEPPARDVLRRKPNDPQSPVITGRDYRRLSQDSAVMTGTALAAYAWGVSRFGIGPSASTIAFVTLTSAQLLHTLNERAPGSDAPPNRYIGAAVSGGLAFEVAALALPPLRSLLGLAPIGLLDIGVCAACAIASLFANRALRALPGAENKSVGLLLPAHQN